MKSVYAPARLAAVTTLLGSLVVILSQLVTAYSLIDDYGLTITTVKLVDKHGLMPIILAVIAVIALIYTVATGNRTGALLIAIAGLTVVFIFLIIDLPDVGDHALYNAPGAGDINATSHASSGLWMELIGGIILTFSGLALTLLDEVQLKAIRPGSRRPERPTVKAPQT